MKRSITKLCLLLALLPLLNSGPINLWAQNTTFTYQGHLTSGDGPANGAHDFEFTLFSAPNGGNPLSPTTTLAAVGVSNGVFTVALDFGASLFNGLERWLAIAVRSTGNQTFTTLTPRQPLTPAPYAITALTALSVPGVDGHSLHAANGSRSNAVFVDNTGRIGIGTTTPNSKLHVVSLLNETVPPRMESVGTNGFGAGWDFYLSGTGKGYVGVPDRDAPIAPGEMLVFGGSDTRTSLWGGGVRALTTDTAGNVEVPGSVRMGANAELKAASGEENLRLVRGVVAAGGGIITGRGFTTVHHGAGDYEIIFDTPFPGAPAVTVTAHREEDDSFPIVMTDGVTGERAVVVIRGGDTTFHFIAIGPR